MTDLQPLVDEAWRIYTQAEKSGTSGLVKPSIPILFFGDSERYSRSRCKIITVGLNPSREEFPEQDRFQRFPAAKSGDYVGALNSYFRTDPYQWFSSYEPLLSGLGASYYDGAENTALHTDLCSPLATNPTWGKLHRGVRASLMKKGKALWHELARVLAPHVILISVAREHLAIIEFTRLGGWREVHAVMLKKDGRRRAKPFKVKAIDLEVVLGRITTMAFGSAAQTPFGTVSYNNRRLIGSALKEKLDAR